MALVHQIIDFVDDIDKSLLKIAAQDAPDHVKKAPILSPEERERLPLEEFALVMQTKEAQVLKKFPITDEPNTWLSCRYFEKTAEQLPFVAQKIAATQLKRACALYGIKAPDVVDKLASPSVAGNIYNEIKSTKEDRAHRESVKTASISSDGSKYFYALGDKYPMPDATFVKKAATYFESYARDFTDAEDRFTFATNVRERSKELDAKLEKKAEDLLTSYSDDTYGDCLDKQIKLREEVLFNKPEMLTALRKLASHKSSTDAQTFAKVLFQLDKRAGITKHYDGFLNDAFKATFHKTAKASFGYTWEDPAQNLSLSEKELEKTATDKYEKIKSYFGQSVADQLKKHAVAIFESLPVDAKATIAKIAKGSL